MTRDLRFRIVGAGRAGRSFARALTGRGAICLGLLERGDDPASAGAAADAVIISVPDAGIEAVARSIDPFDGVVIHVSGASGLDVLGSHRRVGSVHPLVSLPDPDIGAARLIDGATFAVAGDPLARAIVDRLGGTAITVDDDKRALYHATAAVAANHLVVLCAQVERLAERVGVPAEAYWELMEGALDTVRSTGAPAALTGPASRGDLATVQRHLDAIGAHEHALYSELARGAAALAGRPDPTRP